MKTPDSFDVLLLREKYLKRKNWGCLLLWIFLVVLYFIVTPRIASAVSEQYLADARDAEILSFYKAQLEFGRFTGKGGVVLGYAKYEITDEKGALIISNGRTEFLVKYAELIFDLRKTGFSIYIMDHRGQGVSSRMLEDSRKGHVESFDDYVNDFTMFIDHVVNLRPHKKRIILAHSMGGAIAVLYAAKHPDDVHGLILSAPMLQINTWLVPESVVFLFARSFNLFGFGDAYVPGGANYEQYGFFPGNKLTHSQVRFAIAKQQHGFISIHFVISQDESEYGSFSLWESKNDAEAGGTAIRSNTAVTLEELASTPPTIDVFEVYKPG